MDEQQMILCNNHDKVCSNNLYIRPKLQYSKDIFSKTGKKILVKTFLAQHTNLTCKSLEINFKNVNKDL